MKKVFPLLIVLLGMLVACDNRRGELGDLEGMWQLTQMRDKATNEVKATNQQRIYYSFVLDLMKVSSPTQGGNYFLSTFSHRDGHLRMTRIVTYGSFKKEGTNEYYPNETVVDASTPDLQALLHDKYGVPLDGDFQVDVLSDEAMQLSTADLVLVFRKY